MSATAMPKAPVTNMPTIGQVVAMILSVSETALSAHDIEMRIYGRNGTSHIQQIRNTLNDLCDRTHEATRSGKTAIITYKWA